MKAVRSEPLPLITMFPDGTSSSSSATAVTVNKVGSADAWPTKKGTEIVSPAPTVTSPTGLISTSDSETTVKVKLLLADNLPSETTKVISEEPTVAGAGVIRAERSLPVPLKTIFLSETTAGLDE